MPHLQTDLFKGLPGDDAERLLAFGAPMSLPRGGVLFRLGETADRVFVVSGGCVALTVPMSVRGRQEDILVEERMAGETVGWSGLIPPHRFTLKAAAAADSEIVAFPRVALLEHFAAHPAVGAVVSRNIAAVIGHRLQVFQAMWLREMQRAIELRYS